MKPLNIIVMCIKRFQKCHIFWMDGTLIFQYFDYVITLDAGSCFRLRINLGAKAQDHINKLYWKLRQALYLLFCAFCF
jgi:hypothetical protein